MSFFGEIYADPDLPHRARTVYMYLRDRAGGGSCWPGVKTIARDLHLSPRTVQRALNDLEHAGYIERQRRHRENGSCTSNLPVIIRSHSLMDCIIVSSAFYCLKLPEELPWQDIPCYCRLCAAAPPRGTSAYLLSPAPRHYGAA